MAGGAATARRRRGRVDGVHSDAVDATLSTRSRARVGTPRAHPSGANTPSRAGRLPQRANRDAGLGLPRLLGGRDQDLGARHQSLEVRALF